MKHLIADSRFRGTGRKVVQATQRILFCFGQTVVYSMKLHPWCLTSAARIVFGGCQIRLDSARRRAAAGARLVQNFIHGSHQISDAVWLRQQCVNMQPRVLDQLLHWRRSRRQNDCQRHVLGTEFLDEFQTRNLRHDVVSDQNIVVVLLKRLPSSGAIFGGVNMVAGFNQQFGVVTAEFAIIIHQENTAEKIRPALGRHAGWRFRLRDGVALHIASKMTELTDCFQAVPTRSSNRATPNYFISIP